MIYTELTNKAMRIAYKAHLDQYDENGVPYIFHPYHVAEQMNDEITACIALLHDIAEDTDVTIEMLEEEFPVEVTDVLRLLTHEKGTDYFEYIRKIKENPLAKIVKLADIDHNSDETRTSAVGTVTEERLLHWRNKYTKARKLLLDEE